MEFTQSGSRHQLKAFVMVGLASLFYLYMYVLRVVPTIITHDLRLAFNLDSSSLGQLIACFFLGYAPMQIFAGLLCDRYGPRACMSVCIVTCSIAALIFQSTHSFYIACLARVIIGIAASCSFIAPLTLASRWYAPEKQATITGIVQLIGCAGAILSQNPQLTILIQSHGWRSVIFFLSLIGMIIGLFYVLFIQDTPENASSLSVPTGSHQHSTLERLRNILLNSKNWAVGFCSFGIWAPIAVFAEYLGIEYLVELQQISSQEASQQMFWLWIAMAISSPISGWISNLIKNRKKPLFILLLSGLVAFTVLLAFPPKESPFLISLLLFIIGLSSSGQAVTFGFIHDNNEASVISTAIAFNNMVLVLSAGILQPIVGYIIKTLQSNGGITALATYQYAFSLAPICSAMAIIVLQFALAETYCQKQSSQSSMQDSKESTANAPEPLYSDTI